MCCNKRTVCTCGPFELSKCRLCHPRTNTNWDWNWIKRYCNLISMCSNVIIAKTVPIHQHCKISITCCNFLLADMASTWPIWPVYPAPGSCLNPKPRPHLQICPVLLVYSNRPSCALNSLQKPNRIGSLEHQMLLSHRTFLVHCNTLLDIVVGWLCAKCPWYWFHRPLVGKDFDQCSSVVHANWLLIGGNIFDQQLSVTHRLNVCLRKLGDQQTSEIVFGMMSSTLQSRFNLLEPLCKCFHHRSSSQSKVAYGWGEKTAFVPFDFVLSWAMVAQSLCYTNMSVQSCPCLCWVLICEFGH